MTNLPQEYIVINKTDLVNKLIDLAEKRATEQNIEMQYFLSGQIKIMAEIYRGGIPIPQDILEKLN